MEDSARWDQYQPRETDVIVSTHPKCGTTWMEHIVLNLKYCGFEVPLLYDVAPWIELRGKRDMRTPLSPDELGSWMGGMEHPRQIKTHLSLEYLPYYEQPKYIVVGRDTRDACISWHNHLTKAKIPIAEDIREFWPQWIEEGAGQHAPLARDDEPHPLFQFYHSWWIYRHLNNVLLVHFDDLRMDAKAEIARIAKFLELGRSDKQIEEVAKVTSFETMKNRSKLEMPNHPYLVNKGKSGRWRDALSEEDLALYDRAKEEAIELGVSSQCLEWLELGRAQTES